MGGDLPCCSGICCVTSTHCLLATVSPSRTQPLVALSSSLSLQQHVEEIRITGPELLCVIPLLDAVGILVILCADPVTHCQCLRISADL